MDRRGRGSSGDTEPYTLSKECDDIAAVATRLAEEQGALIDVFAHSYGTTWTLGAAAHGAPFRRIALYERPDLRPSLESGSSVPLPWYPMGRRAAMFSFVTEIAGLTAVQFDEYKGAPGAQDVLPIVAATLPREAEALTSANLRGLAAGVGAPVLLLLGATSPAWAGDITRVLLATLTTAEVAILPGHGHVAVDSAPDLVVSELQRLFDDDGLPATVK